MLLLEPVHASPRVGWQMDPASSEDSSHPSSLETWEALSSHLHSLQISHELLESRVRVAEDRLLILSREHEGTSARLQWLERFVAYLRGVFRRFG